MKVKNKSLPLSVVIPSLGQDVLFETIRSLNKGDYNPSEIIVSVPKGAKIDEKIKKIENIKIIRSPIKGQVAQRVYGFKNVNNKYVLQLDDDTILPPQDLKGLIKGLKELGPGNAVSPINFDIDTLKSVTIVNKNLKNFFFDVVTYLIGGSKWGVNKMGTISKSGVVFGVDPKRIVSKKFFSREWLSGCCVAFFKEDLILENYYPFEGKAYFEDVIHSIMLLKKNIKLWTLISAKCYTKIDKVSLNIDQIEKHFERQKYSVILLNHNLIWYNIWCFFYKLYLKFKIIMR